MCAAEQCTEGQPWKNYCNDCICDNGRSICTSRVCTPSTTEQSTGAPATALPPTTALPISPPTTTLPARPAFSGQTLYDAAERGDLELVNKALASGTDVNWKSTGSSYTGSTALHNAVRNHHPSVLRALLDAGANKDAQNDAGSTPISLASFYGHTDLARQLIAEGAAINIPDSVDVAGWYPLHYAVFGDKVAMTELLLRNGADINIPNLNDGDTPLHFVADNNHAAVAGLLLRYGADAWKRNNKGQRPTDIAKAKGYDDLAKTIDKFDG
ncbi:unnamed protein product [Meganyctiphanes norvegica]|uniref:Pacifastin domain-containing protein n=1 Tax=Meganyctiphanes norvegica TaxID=48144 RepID=A0AAV2R4J8_MEGNR